jgi:outer membrane protein
MGRTQSADHQLRLAAEAKDLPPEIARTIRSVRNIIRTKRQWSVNVDFGIAPDTNINNATGADSINVYLPYSPDPMTVSLDPNARAKSGLGLTGSIDGGLRLPVSKNMLMLVDFNAFATQYKHNEYDDLSMELGAGPEFKLSEKVRLRAEGVVAQRDFGNRVVSRQVGVKAGLELTLDQKQQLAVQVDSRSTDAIFDPNYSGWQTAINATYERVIGHTLIASASAFVRRDSLTAKVYSNTEIGGVLGIGGELPKGFNFGLSAGASHASYDAPIALFSPDARRDWRYNLHATLGNRAIRVWGFSPSVSLTYSRGDSSIPYYANERTRFRFVLARYF